MRFPVSLGQQRLWFLDQLDPGEPTSTLPNVMWLDGPLDPGALQRAMDALVARQAALRTSIVAFDGVPEQIVADAATVPVELIELTAGPDDGDRTRHAEAIAARLARQPFDLAAGPLIRATLIRTAPRRHLLVLVMHHIISDDTSAKILADELSAAYRAETTGTPAARPPLAMEYGDYAVWQRDLLRGEELDRQLAYWRERLRGAPEVLTLPADRPRPARPSARGAVTQVTVSAATTRRLAELAQTANASTSAVFLAGFAVLLARYAGQRELVIGTPVPGRTHAELEPILGLFTNTVLLPVSLAGDPAFAGLLDRVRDTTMDTVSHQQLPFEKLVEELAPDRALAHPPLVQVQFRSGPLTPPVLDLPGVTARSVPVHTGTAALDLTLSADTADTACSAGTGDGGTVLTLEYRTDLFGPAWAQGFLRGLAHLLEHAAQAPGTAVADLPVLSAAEIDELITDRSRPPSAVPAPAGHDESPDLWSQLASSASRVRDDRESVPVSELCQRAARLGQVLAGHGVGPETLVGLCVERGTGLLTALLATWWAGGAYVPLDPGFPAARLTAMARDARLGIVVSDGTHRDLARTVAAGATVICVDDPPPAAPPQALAPPQAAAATPDPAPRPAPALACVLFTSGSTGRPRGVGVQHGNVANLLGWARRALRLGPGDRFVAVTTLSFDIALLELLLPPLCGADLVIASAGQAGEPGRLRSLIEQADATAMQATPYAWRLLQQAGGVPACVRRRISGGEPLTRDLADQLTPPGTVLWNLYGPTETTVYSAGGEVARGTGPVVIGPPVDHTRVYVLDERLAPVPVGVPGDVWLAGRGVTRGYHERPELTARSFRPDPWGAEPGARMYRTGDLGRWRREGGLELLGRTDQQVKIHGFRVECGEIEAVLRAHRDVRQAAVVLALRDQDQDPVLVAYVVLRRGSAAAQPGTDLLTQFRPQLRAALPDYMIPGLVVALPALPLTPNAKVDRAALPAPWPAAPAPAGHVGPRNPVEATLARIWAELIEAPAPVGVHDNLLALGGRSLAITRFVSCIADTYGVRLPVRQVYSAPTVAELAEVVSADPDFGHAARSPRDAELDPLSDEELDALLRSALAERSRRQAKAAGPAW